MNKKEALLRSDLVAALKRLGIAPNSDLMVQASLSALGYVEGGANTVVDALRELVEPGGSVIMPAFRDAIRSDTYALKECKNKCPQNFCPSQEPGDAGAIGESVRLQKDAIRSCHPTHSWSGFGANKEFLLGGHHQSLTPCGAESPFFRLMERDGLLLMLGIQMRWFTNVHAVADAFNLPYLSAVDPKNRHATYTTSGRRMQYIYPDLAQALFTDAGLLKTAQVGASASYLASARELASFMCVVTENDPWCWVLRPSGKIYDPLADINSKCARMLKVWKENPDHNAWKRLLEKSREPRQPISFEPAKNPATTCPAYRGVVRGYHRCAANDVPPWEKFEDYPYLEPGVATCQQCNWPHSAT